MKPIVGYTLGQLIAMTSAPSESRQTEWSRKQRAQKLCFCGEPTFGKSLCRAHLETQRKRMIVFRRSRR